MARSLLAQIIAGPPSKEDSSKARQQRIMRQRFSKAGPKSAVERLNPLVGLGGDYYEKERKRRQKDIWSQYRSQRREMIRKRRAAASRMKDELKREQDRIWSRYRLKGKGKMDQGDPRRRLTRGKAQNAYRLLARKKERAFRGEWLAEEHRLESWRKKQYKLSSVQLRTERRAAVGLPAKKQYPWS